MQKNKNKVKNICANMRFWFLFVSRESLDEPSQMCRLDKAFPARKY